MRFSECFKDRGALQSFDSERGGGFRAFLYAVVRNVALRIERTKGRREVHEQRADSQQLRSVEDAEEDLSRRFDREWALSIMQQAREVMHAQALLSGEAAIQRYELLRLRFEEGLPIREIAVRWEREPEAVHRAYRKAREEFQAGLEQAVSYHCTGSAQEIRTECAHLLTLLRQLSRTRRP